jgi:hypothetical protein
VRAEHPQLFAAGRQIAGVEKWWWSRANGGRGGWVASLIGADLWESRWDAEVWRAPDGGTAELVAATRGIADLGRPTIHPATEAGRLVDRRRAAEDEERRAARRATPPAAADHTPRAGHLGATYTGD